MRGSRGYRGCPRRRRAAAPLRQCLLNSRSVNRERVKLERSALRARKSWSWWYSTLYRALYRGTDMANAGQGGAQQHDGGPDAGCLSDKPRAHMAAMPSQQIRAVHQCWPDGEIHLQLLSRLFIREHQAEPSNIHRICPQISASEIFIG